jgi:hypothetical protein
MGLALKIETFLGHEMATHVQKITSVPVFLSLGLNDFDGSKGKSITWAIGRGDPLLMTKKGQSKKLLQSE